MQLTQIVPDHGTCRRWALRGRVLDYFECANASALIAPTADKQSSVRHRSQQNRTRRRQVGIGVEISCDTHGVAEDHGFDIALALDMNPADKLNQRPCLCALVRPLCIDGFACQVQNFEYPGPGMFNSSLQGVKNYRAFQMRDNDTSWLRAYPGSELRAVLRANTARGHSPAPCPRSA